MLRVLTKGAEQEDATSAFDWIRCPAGAVLALSPLSIRHLKKACKGPRKESAKTPKSAGKKDKKGAIEEDSRVYIVLADSSAVDVLWLGSVLPRHILNTLLSEELPAAAREGMPAGGGKGWRSDWFAYIAKSMHLLFCLVQLGVEYPAITGVMQQQLDAAASAGAGARGGAVFSPALLVDVLLFSHTVALAMGYDVEAEGVADADAAASASDSARAGPSGEGAETQLAIAEDEQGGGAGTGGGGGVGEQDASVGGSHPIDVVGMVMKIMALLLRNEHSADERPFRDQLVLHPKVTKALCEGIFDAMDECFEQITKEGVQDRRRRELKTFVEAAMEALFFCCTEQVFVADLLVCSYMRHGRALSVLRKVLYLEHVECVSLMLRWLLLFCEYEDPPSVDVLAGYDLYNKLLLGVMDRNNDAMVAWGVKSPMNPIALDLIKAVEVFADDSNFKQGVIDTTASAVATVLKRGPEYNGFNRSDRIHLPFTRGFFKLIAAMHCFNAEVMPAEQEHHFARSIVAECKASGDAGFEGVEACLECLANLPDTIRKSKDSNVEELMEEDLELVQDLLVTIRRIRTEPAPRTTASKGAGKGKKSPAAAKESHLGAAGKPRARSKKVDEEEADAGGEEEEEGPAVKGKGRPAGGKASKGARAAGEAPAKKSKTGASSAGGGASGGGNNSMVGRSRLRMSEEDLIQKAIEESMRQV